MSEDAEVRRQLIEMIGDLYQQVKDGCEVYEVEANHHYKMISQDGMTLEYLNTGTVTFTITYTPLRRSNHENSV